MTDRYDPTEMGIIYRSTGSMPMHHTGVKSISFIDSTGIRRIVDLEDIRKMFIESKAMSNQDPWRHRSEGMKCRTCMWCVEKEVNEGSKRIGRCRRHAPTMNGYPVVYMDDWCGDHKIDEMKV